MINGNTYSYYGLTLVKTQGALDMPSRIGKTFIDWGDELTPLLHADDIAWKGREIILEVLSDNAINSVSKLSNLPTQFELQSSYGTYQVSLYSVKELRQYLGGKSKLRLTFQEEMPVQNATLPSPVGGKGILIDGYHFKKDLGINVTSVLIKDDLPTLATSSKTVFQTDKKLSEYRGFGQIQLNCSHGTENLQRDIERLKTILSRSGERELNYNGRVFQTFLSAGFKVNINRSLAKFNIKLNVIYEQSSFVAAGFVEAGFIEII